MLHSHRVILSRDGRDLITFKNIFDYAGFEQETHHEIEVFFATSFDFLGNTSLWVGSNSQLQCRLTFRVSHLAQQLCQGHFRVSGLEAAFHRCLHLDLVLRAAHTLDEEIGIATDVLG